MVEAEPFGAGGSCRRVDLLMRAELIGWLRCPSCSASMTPSLAADRASGSLTCANCGLQAPVRHGIPRFVDVPEDETARRTQASFGYEWTHFNNWEQSGETNFNDYFQGLDLSSLRHALVLDGGCGMGRHARQIAPHAGHVVALDFSRAIDQAAHNVNDLPNVCCVQADLLALPLVDGRFDFVYSLGVLHHLADTERALQGLVAKLRPGGRLRIYLYWKKHGWKGRLLALATAARRVTTRMPFWLLRAACFVLSLGLFVGVVLPYRVLAAAGVRGLDDWPLFVYSKYPFNVLYNDQFDRFSAPIEKRYDADEVRRLLEGAGLLDVSVRPCFGWLADGIKPAA
jgi:SAM-dependent methyltransferase